MRMIQTSFQHDLASVTTIHSCVIERNMRTTDQSMYETVGFVNCGGGVWDLFRVTRTDNT